MRFYSEEEEAKVIGNFGKYLSVCLVYTAQTIKLYSYVFGKREYLVLCSHLIQHATTFVV
jgi:hypothetical protein